MITRKGNPIYPASHNMRTAIIKESLCKHCKHLGDPCGEQTREFKKIGFPVQSVVIECDGHETVQQ